MEGGRVSKYSKWLDLKWITVTSFPSGYRDSTWFNTTDSGKAGSYFWIIAISIRYVS